MKPYLQSMRDRQETVWINTHRDQPENQSFTLEDIQDAENRLKRFAPFIQKAFPETAESNGIIESPLLDISRTLQMYPSYTPGKFLLKADSHLPVSGSIKARGGIYEILHHAEKLVLENKMLSIEDNYSILCEERFQSFFAKHRIAVGSTGNLGLSIGIISRALGFEVTIHMSSDAKSWKKNMLREKGAQVIEYVADYSVAVKNGRKQAELDPMTYFVDDENSTTLFLGYATAALRLKKQLDEMNICIDKHNPLFVYLPCGVGGAPGGITFGLKEIYGDDVHIFFAEPVEAPCMFLGILTGKHDEISVTEIGLTNQTEADGLAVGRPSGLVCKAVGHLISGFYTLDDKHLYKYLKRLYIGNHVKIEPSSAIALAGFEKIAASNYLEEKGFNSHKITHIAWATGGNMVPDSEFQQWLIK
jgi:D-serine dehydratase